MGYDVGDRVLVREVRGMTSMSHTWHEGTVIGSRRSAGWLWVKRYDVRLSTGADQGGVLTVDRRNLKSAG